MEEGDRGRQDPYELSWTGRARDAAQPTVPAPAAGGPVTRHVVASVTGPNGKLKIVKDHLGTHYVAPGKKGVLAEIEPGLR